MDHIVPSQNFDDRRYHHNPKYVCTYIVVDILPEGDVYEPVSLVSE